MKCLIAGFCLIALSIGCSAVKVQDWEETYWKSGRVKERFQVVNGKKEGQFFGFYEEGSIAELGMYKADRREGTWCSFYPNGAVNKVYENHLDNLKGISREFDRNGNLIKEERH